MVAIFVAVHENEQSYIEAVVGCLRVEVMRKVSQRAGHDTYKWYSELDKSFQTFAWIVCEIVISGNK